MTDLSKRLRDMAESIRLYEGGPSTEEATALEAALAIEQQDTDAAQAERAAIVAWLRAQGGDPKSVFYFDNVDNIADAIERGDHLPGGGE